MRVRRAAVSGEMRRRWEKSRDADEAYRRGPFVAGQVTSGPDQPRPAANPAGKSRVSSQENLTTPNRKKGVEMRDISRDTLPGGGTTVLASGDQLTYQEVNLRRNAAVAVKDRKEVSL